jgi:c-di-AMP phosphodiesterase-like protein
MNLTLPITLSYILIVILMVMIMLMGFILLINKKVEMMYLLRPFTYKLENFGYLTEEDQRAIESRLTDLGLENQQIEIKSASGVFGGVIQFDVRGQYDLKWFDGFLTHRIKTIDLNYHRDVIVKRIDN